MRKKWFARKMLLYTVIAMIPLLIFGSISIAIFIYYINQDIDRSNVNIFRQVQENVEMIFNEFDNLILNYEMNPTITSSLKTILDKNEFSYDDYKALRMIDSFVLSNVASKEYMHSIVVYYRNSRMQYYSSLEGISTINADLSDRWYKSFLSNYQKKQIWTETGTMLFESGKSTRVISIYKYLYTSEKIKPDGVVVLNVQYEYFQNLLNSIEIIPEQNLIVLDENGQVVLSRNDLYLDLLALSTLHELAERPAADKFSIFMNTSKKNGWTYLSIAPNAALYRASSWALAVLVLMLLLSLIFGALMAYSVTKTDYSRLCSIIEMLEDAENEKAIPLMPDTVTDEYGMITRNIIRTFLTQNISRFRWSVTFWRRRAASCWPCRRR